MGGDLAPKAAVEGGVMAARDFGIELILVGNRDLIAREMSEHDTSGLNIRVEHAPEVVLMDDSPLESILSKPHSSLHLGFDLVKSAQADAFVSAGNSGAMMVAASVILGNLTHVDRPAIGTIVPTAEGQALLIDAGANTEVKPLNLVQFAVMGTVYWRRVRNVSRPRLGILSNGEEPSKGTDLTRSAAASIGQMGSYLNYIGYVEGRDINRGKADVIVTDGFTGNVALKTMEGFAVFMRGVLRELFGGTLRSRIAYLLIRKRLAEMVRRLDPDEAGGAPLLGVAGVAIIAHGSSSARAIRNAVRAAADESLVRHVNPEITEILSRIQTAAPAKPAGKGIRALFSKMRDRLQRHPRDGAAPHELDNSAKPSDVRPPQTTTLELKSSESGRPREPLREATPDPLLGHDSNHIDPLHATDIHAAHDNSNHDGVAPRSPNGTSPNSVQSGEKPRETAPESADTTKDHSN